VCRVTGIPTAPGRRFDSKTLSQLRNNRVLAQTRRVILSPLAKLKAMILGFLVRALGIRIAPRPPARAYRVTSVRTVAPPPSSVLHAAIARAPATAMENAVARYRRVMLRKFTADALCRRAWRATLLADGAPCVVADSHAGFGSISAARAASGQVIHWSEARSYYEKSLATWRLSEDSPDCHHYLSENPDRLL
jgi:hypothetical protein